MKENLKRTWLPWLGNPNPSGVAASSLPWLGCASEEKPASAREASWGFRPESLGLEEAPSSQKWTLKPAKGRYFPPINGLNRGKTPNSTRGRRCLGPG